MRWLVRRVQSSFDQGRQVVKDPKTVTPLLRRAALRLWRARGGGFYGLGYLICFCVLQVRSFAGDVDTARGVGDFVAGQVPAYVMRVTVDSFANGLLALLWPLLAVAEFGLAGLAAIAIGYLAFERWLRPGIETWLPELREPPADCNAPPK